MYRIRIPPDTWKNFTSQAHWQLERLADKATIGAPLPSYGNRFVLGEIESDLVHWYHSGPGEGISWQAHGPASELWLRLNTPATAIVEEDIP